MKKKGMKKCMKLSGFFAILTFILLTPASTVFAARVEKQNDVPIRNDFPTGPTSFDVEVNPGEVVTKQIQVDNRMGKEQKFEIAVEDFQGSAVDPSQTVLLQAEKEGKYGAKEWIKPEISHFSTQHGERQYLNVTVTVPGNAEPGDHYASVLVSAPPQQNPENNDKPNVVITSRVGVLFFVRVKGEIKKEGKLQSFGVQKRFFEKPPVSFNAVYKNTGTTLLRMEGGVDINNMFGKQVGYIDIKTDRKPGEENAYSFNILRDSVRGLQMQWVANKFYFGLYKAKLKLKHQYTDEIETKTVSFWILPWKVVAGILVGIILLFATIRYIRRNVQVTLRKK